MYLKSCSNFNWCSTGSILGPLLFSIYINDLVMASSKFKNMMYADDATLYFNLEDLDCRNLDNEINSKIKKIKLWLKLNKLSLNADQTKYIIFHADQRMISPITLSINGKFSMHGIIKDYRHQKRLKYTFPIKILFSLYNLLFIPYIQCGLLLWGSKYSNVEKLTCHWKSLYFTY